jgi:Ala-tRNA(Pro) deacylase
VSESTLRSSRAKGGSGLATSDLTRLLDDAGLEYELLPHAHTESAAAEAEALGLAATDVAKTLVVKTPEGYVRAVLPASERLDLRKLREFLGVGKHDVHLATEDDLRRDFPEFELGAAPPVGGGRPDPVVIERRLVGRESLVLEAGSHEESIRVAADDFVRFAGAQPADICED